ncbi:peptidoglycan DD-metalloendopeptidase family protein [Imhoffiella purpurea]|uniref:Lipoprotein NlpD n=1 Tax=Imhoffiella purpurea TaxID=1249627 RepID=W9VB86_9GAMM|nr:peptidoglycan DD-metalloendopeptidase family protein [Imhoffiella purpurea]EXJ16828.1 Lipoprotein NlpD [Imhoffiella purpurea]
MALILFLSALVGTAIWLAGCASRHPAPVYGWNWTGPVPEGFYLVRQGDSLSVIAERLNISSRRLAKWNRLEPPFTIYADTLLRIAPPGKAPPRRLAPVAAAPGADSPPAATRRSVGRQAKGGDLEGAGSRRAASGVVWSWPLDGPLIQTFREGDRTHSGIRIGGAPGDTIRATADGQVVYSGGGLKGYGNLIIVKHNDKYLSAYGFNRRLLVVEGESVKRGQAVAEIGQGGEGRYLLHFEVRRNGTAVDPILYLPPRN